MSVKETSKPKKYELVAPDGGWGYVIWIALTINIIATSVFMSCVGMIYNDIYIQLKMDSTSINLLNGISSISVSIAGFITAPLLSCLSVRKLGMISAVILNLGSVAVVFVNSRELFFLSFGVLQGVGTGALINLTFTTINQYFVKKRMLTISVIQTVTAIASLITPQFIKWSLEEYGCRGTLILILGVNMQAFVAIALIQPVEWHMKKMEIDIISEDKYSDIKTLLKREESAKEIINTSASKQSGIETLVPAEKKELSEIDAKEVAKKNSVLRKMFNDFLDVSFLKSFLLSNASIGLAISAFSDILFMIMLPQALYAMDWTESEVAWAISITNLGDLVMKVIFILFNSILLRFGNSEIFVVGLLMAFFSRLGMLWSDNPVVMLTFIVIIGMARSIITIMYPLVIGESVDKEKFPAAMGIFMLQYGITFLIFGPLIGAIRDLTNSYGTAFYIITSCFAIVSLFWLIELLYKKNKDKRVKTVKSYDTV